MVHRKAMYKPEMDETLRTRLKVVKANMVGRCYNPNNPKYKNYGARGVTIDPKWRKLKGFLEDYDKIDDWDEDKFINKQLQLDKDIKYPGNKNYSKDTCKWVSPKENSRVKPSYQKKYTAVRVDGYSEEFVNVVDFFEKWCINQANGIVREVAEGRRPYYTNWYFYFKGSKPKPPIVYRAKREEESKVSFKQSEVERFIGAKSGTFSSMKKNNIKNKKHEGWGISWYSLPC